MFKLYSASLRRHLEIRAPYLEASRELPSQLRQLEAWKHKPSVITDADGRIIDSNNIDVEHH